MVILTSWYIYTYQQKQKVSPKPDVNDMIQGYYNNQIHVQWSLKQ